MSKNNENILVPKLRFPEFANEGEWSEDGIGDKFKFKQGVQVPIENQYLIYQTGLVRFIRIIDVTNKREPYRYIDNPGNEHLIRENDLFMIRYGTPGVVSIGYTGVIANNLFRLIWKDTEPFIPTYWFYSFQKKEKAIFDLSGSSSMPAISFSTLESLKIQFPLNSKEQQKIADCLSSLDEVITAESQKLEVLKDHKKGLLQNLLPQAGETVPKFRFKEFEDSGEWVERTIEEVAKVTTGNKDTQNKVDDGEFPFFVRSQNVERINSYSYDGEAILTSGDGVGVGKNFHYIVGKFDFHQRVYCIYDFEKEVSGRFVYMYFSQHFYERVMRMSAKNSVDSVRRAMITEMPILLPSKKEQEKIADTLSSIDDLIIAQNQKIEALQLHKKGLLQGLFPTLSETGFTGLKDEKDSKT